MDGAKSDPAAPRGRHYGLWRAVLAFPTMLGSLALVVMLSGGLGPWAADVPLAWLLVAPVWLTRAGEHAAARLGLGYRDVRTGEWIVLEPVTSTAAGRCGLDDGACDFYVQPHAHTFNAYAGGRRSIGVSAGLLTALEQGRLTRDHAVAILSHEVGHLRDRSTRYGLVTAWLTAPWRGAVFILAGLLRPIVRHLPTAKAALMLVPVLLVVAGVQSVQQHAWAPLAVLTVLAVVVTVHPVADAALSRASERAADNYAASVGRGSDLASALAVLPRSPRASCGELRASHPSVDIRIARLTGTTPGGRSRRSSLLSAGIGIRQTAGGQQAGTVTVADSERSPAPTMRDRRGSPNTGHKLGWFDVWRSRHYVLALCMVVPSSLVLAVVFGAASHRVRSLPLRQRAVVVLRPAGQAAAVLGCSPGTGRRGGVRLQR